MEQEGKEASCLPLLLCCYLGTLSFKKRLTYVLCTSPAIWAAQVAYKQSISWIEIQENYDILISSFLWRTRLTFLSQIVKVKVNIDMMLKLWSSRYFPFCNLIPFCLFMYFLLNNMAGGFTLYISTMFRKIACFKFHVNYSIPGMSIYQLVRKAVRTNRSLYFFP